MVSGGVADEDDILAGGWLELECTTVYGAGRRGVRFGSNMIYLSIFCVTDGPSTRIQFGRMRLSSASFVANRGFGLCSGSNGVGFQ